MARIYRTHPPRSTGHALVPMRPTRWRWWVLSTDAERRCPRRGLAAAGGSAAEAVCRYRIPTRDL